MHTYHFFSSYGNYYSLADPENDKVDTYCNSIFLCMYHVCDYVHQYCFSSQCGDYVNVVLRTIPHLNLLLPEMRFEIHITLLLYVLS